MPPFLGEINFRDTGRALDSLARLTSGLPDLWRAHIRSLLAASSDPDQALLYLERLRQQHPASFDGIAGKPGEIGRASCRGTV